MYNMLYIQSYNSFTQRFGPMTEDIHIFCSVDGMSTAGEMDTGLRRLGHSSIENGRS
jgi:hypothetical protein